MAVYYSCDNWGESGRCHAGNKARDDVNAILDAEGYQPLYVDSFADDGAASSLFKKVKRHIANARNWLKAFDSLRLNDTLIMQFPLPSDTILSALLVRKVRAKGIRLILFVHDIEMLRQENPTIKVKMEEKPLIEAADKLIVHNDTMATAFTRELGVDRRKLVPLRIFDYLISKPVDCFDPNGAVVVAGNLDSSKAGYLSTEESKQLGLKLYGPNLSKELQAIYDWEGPFSSEDLPEALMGSFGLVWDGETSSGCCGQYGNYLRLNNPHKTSLYLSCGMPVIVWKESAISSLVTSENVGISVATLDEIPYSLAMLSKEDLKQFRVNAIRLSKRLKTGAYTKEAVAAAVAGVL